MDKPSITQFFEDHLKPKAEADAEIRYAMAALLIACSKADDEEDPDEESVIVDILQDKFHMEEKMLNDLMDLTDTDTGSNPNLGLNTFTDLVNTHYSAEQKVELLGNLWQVAFADGRVDKFEESFINRVASLIDTSPADVARAKLIAKLD